MRRMNSDINVTPMADTMLVFLNIFKNGNIYACLFPMPNHYLNGDLS